MPVPIANFTTFAQFRKHLLSLGCVTGSLTNVHSADPLIYFENPTLGITPPPDFVMKALSDGDEVLPSQIRSACDQLKIDPAEFGFGYP